MAYEMIGMDLIKHAGFNDYAVTNDLIVLYPQVRSNLFLNTFGLWSYYADEETKFGQNRIQMKAIKAMVDRLTEPTLRPEFDSYNEY